MPLVWGVTRDMPSAVAEFSRSKNELSTSEILVAVAEIKELCTLARVTKFPMQKGDEEAIIAERQRKRTRMLELGMNSFERIYEVAKSERSAEEAQYRIQAYQVLARLGTFNAALLRDATEDEILTKMIQLEHENEKLDTVAREIQSRATQDAQYPQQPKHRTGKPK
ncbi:hypothetical protein A3K71_04005 [archaeon RBG_16_50_20]|nr:MAG: hypothetical protein A3K71_04005 [archaeon RBG_16_50_20]